MLLRNTCDVIKSLVVKLVFDDESVKTRKIDVNDLVSVTFNKDGCRRSIEGIVKKIEDENCPKKTHWYMIVDGSTNGISRIEKVYASNILDIEVTRKANQTVTIGSPMDSSRIVSMRLVGDILQITQDGTHWISVVKVPQSESEVIVDPEDQELAEKIARLIPKRIPAERRVEMIENLVSLYREELKNETENSGSEETPVTPPEESGSDVPDTPTEDDPISDPSTGTDPIENQDDTTGTV